MKSILKDILESPQFVEGTAWKRKQYHVNETVVKSGDPGKSLFFVEEGELRVTGRVKLDGEKFIQPGVGDLKAGDLFGETCLQVSLPRIATVIAITEASLVEINGEKLGDYLDANPAQGYLFYKSLFEIFIGRLNRANHTVETLMAWGLKAHDIDQYL